MSSPLVSFIIPAYNAHLYIERCIRSICAQTYRNLEILILMTVPPMTPSPCASA